MIFIWKSSLKNLENAIKWNTNQSLFNFEQICFKSYQIQVHALQSTQTSHTDHLNTTHIQN
jgi:hypothetical protein